MTNATSEHGCLCPRYPVVVSNECPLHRNEFNAAMAKYGDWERPRRASHSEGSSAETSSPEVPEHVLADTDSALYHALNSLCGPGAQHEDTCDRAEHDEDGQCIWCEARTALAACNRPGLTPGTSRIQSVAPQAKGGRDPTADLARYHDLTERLGERASELRNDVRALMDAYNRNRGHMVDALEAKGYQTRWLDGFERRLDRIAQAVTA